MKRRKKKAKPLSREAKMNRLYDLRYIVMQMPKDSASRRAIQGVVDKLKRELDRSRVPGLCGLTRQAV